MNVHGTLTSFHIITRTSFACLRSLSKLRRVLRRSGIITLVQALVLSRLVYCAPLLVVVSGALVARLQRIHNYATQLVCRLHWRDGVATSLKELRWLPVERRI